MANLDYEEQTNDIRLVATIVIWVVSIFLLLACVPIIALIENGFWLPLAVLMSVVISTAFIWVFGNRKKLEHDKKIELLQNRISNLEAITDLIEFDKKLINENNNQ